MRSRDSDVRVYTLPISKARTGTESKRIDAEGEGLTTGRPPTHSLAAYPDLLAVLRSTPLIVSASALPSSASSL